jgi:hypothetical protein
MWFLFPLYLLLGTFATVAYRWSAPVVTDGQDVLLDVLLWPLMVYYWLKYGKP